MEENIEILLKEIRQFDHGLDVDTPQNEKVLYLAFIGDTIFDLLTRDYLIRHHISKIKMGELHKKNSNLVCAKSQADIVERLIDDKVLSEEEEDFYKHARNAHPRSKSKNSSIIDYRKATGLEALLGLLYYKKDIDRLKILLLKITEYLDEIE